MPPRRPTSDNDNDRNARPSRRFAFDIYRAGNRARWIGQIVAISANAAIEAAAVEFKTDARKLIAVPRHESP